MKPKELTTLWLLLAALATPAFADVKHVRVGVNGAT